MKAIHARVARHSSPASAGSTVRINDEIEHRTGHKMKTTKYTYYLYFYKVGATTSCRVGKYESDVRDDHAVWMLAENSLARPGEQRVCVFRRDHNLSTGAEQLFRINRMVAVA
jgi:hypothetical protein